MGVRGLSGCYVGVRGLNGYKGGYVGVRGCKRV